MVTPVNFAQSDAGLLYFGNGFQSVKRYDGTTAGIESAGVVAPTTAITLAGSGSGSLSGAYTAYQRFVDRLGNFSNVSPISNTLVATSKASFDYSNVPVPTSSQVVARQILRNANGNTATYYVDIETSDLTGTSFSSTKSDAALIAGTAVTVADFVSGYGVPPDDLPLMINSKSRMLMSGEAVYSEGAVALTSGSATVAGIGTNWTSVMAGRYLHVTGQTAVLISAVNTTTQTLTLSATWPGTTSAFSHYGIRSSSGRRRLVAWSSAGLPEAMDVTDSTSVSRETGIGDIAALFSMGSLVYLAEQNREHVFSFLNDPSPAVAGGDGAIFPRTYRGAVNQRCVVIVESVAYVLDQLGIHAFDGNGVASISVPIDDLFDGGGYYDYRVNYAHGEFFHGIHEKQQGILRWFVSLDARQYPHHAICYSVSEKRFWLEEYAVPITSSCAGFVGDQEIVFLGSSSGRVFLLADGELDGVDPDGGTTTGTVTSSGIISLTDACASFNSVELAGSTVDIVAGTGVGQRRTIVSAQPTRLMIRTPWTTLPDTTSVYQLGGVQYRWKSGVFRYVPIESSNQRAIEVQARPASTGTAAVRGYLNRSSSPVEWGLTAVNQGVATTKGSAAAVLDIGKADGYWRMRVDGLRQPGMDGNRFLEVELSGVKGADHMAFYEMNLEGVVQ